MASHNVVTFPDSLQYADGDVIFQASKNPSGILVVHSHVLAEGSEYFRAMFKSCGWAKSKTLRDAWGTKRTIWNLQMFFDRETKLCLLTDRVCYVFSGLPRHVTNVGQPEKINEDRDIDFPFLEPSEKDNINVPPFDQIRDWKTAVNNARSRQPRKNFL